MRVRRVDLARLDTVERTPQGGIRAPARLARTGVQVYQMPDGTERREYRPADEVFHADALASLRDAPVTDLHPASVVHAANWRELSVGHVGEDVRREGDFVAATVVVQDATEVERVLKGERKELSVGYEVEIDPTPGTSPEGERYDAVQRKIRANHVGLGPDGWGRAGSEVALRLDGAGVQVQRADGAAAKETRSMKVIKIGGREFKTDAPEEMAAAQGEADKQQAKQDADAAALVALQKALQDAMGALAAMQAKQEAAAGEQKTPPEGEAAMVDGDDPPADVMDSWDQVRAVARRHEIEPKGQKLSALKRAVVVKVMGAETKLDGLDAKVVDGMYRAVARTVETRNDSLARANAIANDGGTRADGAPDAAAAQRTGRAKAMDAWKPKGATK
jgi:hypothetical protein